MIANTPDIARQAAALVLPDYEEEGHDAELRANHPALYMPDGVDAGFAADTFEGDLDKAFAGAGTTAVG